MELKTEFGVIQAKYPPKALLDSIQRGFFAFLQGLFGKFWPELFKAPVFSGFFLLPEKCNIIVTKSAAKIAFLNPLIYRGVIFFNHRARSPPTFL
jgi:hypothetical protein